jgi:hypothetical protein
MLTGNALIRILADDLFASDLNELGVGVEDEEDDDGLLFIFNINFFILSEHQN